MKNFLLLIQNRQLIFSPKIPYNSSLVPGGRVELPWIAPHDFESCTPRTKIAV